MAEDTEEDWFERAIESAEEATGDDDDGEESTGNEGEWSTGKEDDAQGSTGDEDVAEETEDVQPTAAVESDLESAFRDADAAAASTPPEAPDGIDAEPAVDTPTGGAGETFGFDLEPEPTFEADDYRTEIPRIDVGIDGLDEMIQGGIPRRTLIVAIGGPGTGKTTFGLQFLNEALQDGERAAFIALDESRERIIESAEEKGWPFGEYEADGDLVVVDLDPVDMANSLASIRNDLPRLIEEFGATRITLDSVSLLEMMFDDQATRRTEIYDFARSLKDAGVTTMVTSEADEANPFASRYGVIEYLTDAVFILRYVRPEEFQETRLAIEIQKIRDANHSRATKPYEITSTGIAVYRQANIF